jgi:pimeloyl-ACP methyl ester carboxylesterase
MLLRSAPVNIAYQHGAFSDARAFERMNAVMSQTFSFAHVVAPTLDWRASLETQATQLNNHLVASGASRFIVVGHSNGGLIARRAAQLGTVTDGPVIGAVIAISSPHLGLPLANNSRTAVNNMLSGQLQQVTGKIGGSCGAKLYAWLCNGLSDVALTFLPKIVNYAFDAAIPMSAQVRPGSIFTQTLNNRPESFMRYAVVVESQGAWKFIRLLGDWKCNPEDRCSGNHLQNIMESVYDVLRYCGSNELSKLINSSVAERCRNVRWALNDLNNLYERLTAPGDNSDGVVPAKSQTYPRVQPENIVRLRNAKESHVGELKSATVREVISPVIRFYSKTTI